MKRRFDISSAVIQMKSLSDQRRKMSAYILFFLFLQQRYTEASVGEWSTSLLLLLFYIMLMISSTHTHTRNIPHLTTPPSSGWSLAIPLLCNISCRTALYVIPRNPINLIDSGRLWSPQLYDTVPTKYLKHRKLQHWLLSNNILSLI